MEKPCFNKKITIGLSTGMMLFNGLLLPNTAYLDHKTDRSEVIVKVADNGAQAINTFLYLPEGVTVDSNGNLFIADTFNCKIHKVTAGKITTVAGIGGEELGRGTISGDGGPAVAAKLNLPPNIAIDAKGNIFFADKDNHRVRKIDSSGIITTIVGTGQRGFSGDGGPAVNARLTEPVNVTLDARGNLFIGDTGNSRIRKVDTSGIITTFAGNGFREFSGDGGPALNAAFDFPAFIAADNRGNLFVADKYNNRIRKIDSSGIITTVAGTGKKDFSGDGGLAVNAALDEPIGVAVDTKGNLFISDSSNHCIRKVDRSGIITTIAGTGNRGFSGDGGSAQKAGLAGPEGLVVDGDGNLFIADTGNNRVRKIDTAGIITTVAGSGKKEAVDFNVTFEK